MDTIKKSPQIGARAYRRPDETVSRSPHGSKNAARQSRPDSNATPKAFLPRQPDIKIVNEMQVTDGKHRGLQLRSTLSPKVHSTARRVREALFSVLGKRIRFARFLDLCAGSGAVGIEAISRGSSLCTFVERSAKMCHYIKENLEVCKICPTGHGEIVQIEAIPYLKRMAARRRRWDVIYFDPPSHADYDEVLKLFARGACLRKEGGILIVEHPAEMFFPQTLGKLERRRVVREGESALTFYERVS